MHAHELPAAFYHPRRYFSSLHAQPYALSRRNNFARFDPAILTFFFQGPIVHDILESVVVQSVLKSPPLR
jgi:hypothetical protein